MKFTDTSEKALQHLIVDYLVQQQGYTETFHTDFDREFCLNTKQLMEFIQTTQPEAYEMIQRKGERSFLSRLDSKLTELGVVEVLRKGVKHFDKTISLFFREPDTTLNPKDIARFKSNVLTVTQEAKYSLAHQNRLDVTLFVNGIPVITMELKNPLSGQTIHHAIRQYQDDRDPKEKLFSFGRCMAHFAADTELVYMCTQLNGKKSGFLPFNKGLNDGGNHPPFGAGNPINPNGLKSHYLWEQVLAKQSLCNIIDKFAQIVEETDEDTGKKKKKMVFPRYHQL
ncbi:MAG TPA: type I restriction endonuclease, partial [Bacteroidia bacterium]|nr:type I restriction endonuclease [Bacteroidia bacterium]